MLYDIKESFNVIGWPYELLLQLSCPSAPRSRISLEATSTP